MVSYVCVTSVDLKLDFKRTMKRETQSRYRI